MLAGLERFEAEQWVAAERERVFRFFADPRNLPLISPPSSGARLVRVELVPPPGAGMEGFAGAGSLIEISARVIPYFPLRVRWTARILEFDYGNSFTDEQERGPFRRWLHTHSFRDETRAGRAGTVVRDEVNYEIGFGPLEPLVNAIAVRVMLRRMFAHRQRATERNFSSSS